MPSNFDELNLSVRELIRKNPDNPITRNVLRKIGYIIPSNISGSDSLIDFLNSLPAKKQSSNRTNITTVSVPTTNRNNDREYMSVDVTYSQIEYGNCRYSVRCSGASSVRVPLNIIREAIENDNTDEIVDYIRDHLDHDYNDYGGYDYEDHDYSDSDNYEDNIDSDMADNLMERYIDTYGNPNESEDE